MTGKLTINDNNSSALTDLFEIKRNTTNKDLIIISNIEEDNKEDMNKTFDEKNSRKLTENLLKTKDGPLIELSKKDVEKYMESHPQYTRLRLKDPTKIRVFL